MVETKLLVEGWRFLPHSYAIVNQWQLLTLSRNPRIELRVRDLPFYSPNWKQQAGLTGEANEAALNALQQVEAGFVPDVTLRIASPCDLAAAPSGRIAVFATSEYQVYAAEAWRHPLDPAVLAMRTDLVVVTPSRWSAEGLGRIGIPAKMIRVVPHGVNLDVFAPDAESGVATRRKLGIGPGIVFMNAGAMTANKGADLLLRAFAELCLQRSDVYLLLKGTDDLYRSKARLGVVLQGLEAGVRDAVLRRIAYSGASLPLAEMAALYRAADVYVSPYRAEGFNLPVLEAMASGLPVICTSGGPTDDFVSADGAHKVFSQRVAAAMPDGGRGVQLQPDLAHLTSLMRRAAEDAAWRRSAGVAGRQQAAKFTWEKAVESLLAALLA